MATKRKRSERREARQVTARAKGKTLSLAQVCQAPQDFLGKLDVAALNLMCAGGLPHAAFDIGKQLAWIDEAARKVDFDTRRHWYRFTDSPSTYNNSPGYFCCYFLLQTLQEDFGVKYNPARVSDLTFQDPKCINPDFSDSRDLFIHGIIDGPGGTCASMPVIYVAVGRRLGYPVKLVESRGHLFFRWDDPLGVKFGSSERFNVEGAGDGIGSYPDEYYRAWPEAWTAAEEAAGCYLKSLSPTEELAAFLCTRGECLTDSGQIHDAIQAYQWACGLLPTDARYRWRLMSLIRKAQANILELNEMIAFQRDARERAERALPGVTNTPFTTPPHGDYCQCYHCREARQASGKRGRPGHHPQCCCVACRQPQPTFNQSRPW